MTKPRRSFVVMATSPSEAKRKVRKNHPDYTPMLARLHTSKYEERPYIVMVKPREKGRRKK